MSRPKTDRVQVVLRVPRDWLGKADAVAKYHSHPSLALTRTDGFRIAMGDGFSSHENAFDRQVTVLPPPDGVGFNLINVRSKRGKR